MPSQTSPTLDDILRVLNAATDRKTLRWTRTAEEDTFRAQFATWMVRIAKGSDAPRFVLSILDQEGTLLDEYPASEEGTPIAIEALYKKARSEALNLDLKLKSVYDHLKALAGES